jgi:hypothetical protein
MAVLQAVTVFCGPSRADFILERVFEASLDLPRIYFLFKRDPDGPPIEYQGTFELNYGFLDTGASGILMSRETADLMGLAVEPGAVFVDVGVGGEEYFDVSETLYLGTAGLEEAIPENPDIYDLSGPWRLQVKQDTVEWPEEPLDVLGVPLMAGRVAVLNSGATNSLEYFAADITDPCDPAIPAVDFNVRLRFDKFISPTAEWNVPPLPSLAYNPVMDNVTVEYGQAASVGSWVFDTGGTISLMSVGQAIELGLLGAGGEPVVTPDFTLQIGGVGSAVEIPGYELAALSVPTLCGFDLVYLGARVGVHDIIYFDEDLGDFTVIDGIFGSNFLCASAKLEGGWPTDLSETAFDHIVVDMNRGLLGFDVNDVYEVPDCNELPDPPRGDLNFDYSLDGRDVQIFAEEWLGACGPLNFNCRGCDAVADGIADFKDFTWLF